MPQRRDVHVPGTFYHVTLRGAYRREVFFAPEERRLLIGILTDVVERFAGKLHCYSNVDDSLQLLIQVGEEPLGRMMLRVARRYAHCVHARLESSTAQTLPDASEVVNRLFEMRFRSTVHPGAGHARIEPVEH
jgi:putative transposase